MLLTIYTGCAKGVDTHVEHLCHKSCHQCVVLIPTCHPRAWSITPISWSALDATTPTITQVAFWLGRSVSNPITLQYLQRLSVSLWTLYSNADDTWKNISNHCKKFNKQVQWITFTCTVICSITDMTLNILSKRVITFFNMSYEANVAQS